MNAAACVSCEMSRRGFVSAATLAALSAVITACGSSDGPVAPVTPTPPSGGGGGTTPPSGLPNGVTRSGNIFSIDLSASNDLLTTGVLVLTGGAVPALVVRAAADSYRAFDARCPHAGTSNQWDLASGQLRCNNHGSRFTAQDGALSAGPATTGLRALPVTRAGSTLTVTAV